MTPNQIEEKGRTEALKNLLKCGLCGSKKVKIYRPYGNFYRPPDNRCNKCVTTDQRDWYVPCITDEDGHIWGYTSIPEDAILTFYALPEKSKKHHWWNRQDGKSEGWREPV